MPPTMPSLLYHLTPCAILFFVARNVFHRVTYYPEIIPVPTPVISEKKTWTLFDRNNVTSTSTSSFSTNTLDPSVFLRDNYYWPPNKQQKTNPSQHAIIIPYRDRPYHLKKFLEYMNPYLQRHFPGSTFSLWIVEQDDDQLFNRAWLANVGLNEIIKHAPQTKCVIMHDVDLVPNQTNVMVPYTTCTYPTQLGRSLQNWKWKIPYHTYCGGITSLSLKHWQTVNGMSNDYIGWGGEDDDLYHRMRINGLLQQPSLPGVVYAPVPRRPRPENGAFRAISQSAKHHTQNKHHESKHTIYNLLDLMYQNSGRWKHDGLNDAYYTVTKRNVQKNATAGFKEVHHVWSIPQKSWSAVGSSDNSQQPILELVPIPYTGANEVLTTTAARAGIVWGACHYLDPSQSALAKRLECPEKGSGDFRHAARFDATYQQAQEPWYLPPLAFADALHGRNPLEGTHRFAVVRHPYQRALELYRSWNEAFHHANPEQSKKQRQIDATRLNYFLQLLFRNGQTDLLLPQTDYIFVKGTQYTQHVLRYEHLLEDLGAVTQQYGFLGGAMDWNALDAWMQEQAKLDSNPTESSRLGVEDLSDETIAVLNWWFEADFNRLEYEPKVVNDQSLIEPAKPKTPPTHDPSRLLPLQLIDIPYTGGEVLTKAASKAGVVWGACHFRASKDLCPLSNKGRSEQQGGLASTWKFRADPHHAQKPWLLSPSLFIPRLFKGHKTFAIVRNPYDRAIDFYRDMYNQQEQGLYRNGSLADRAHGREDPRKLNIFLQNVLVRYHHPHQEDLASIPPLQSGYAKTADHVIRYESWRKDLEDLLTTYNMTSRSILIELPLGDAPLLAPEPSANKGHWLQMSDLDNITIDMLNRRYGLDFSLWYKQEKQQVSVTTKSDQYWRLGQSIPKILEKGKNKYGFIQMSSIKKMIFLNSTEAMEALTKTNPEFAKKVSAKKKKGVPTSTGKPKKGTKKTTKKGTSTTKKTTKKKGATTMKKAKTRWGKAKGTKTTKKGTSATTVKKKGKPTTKKMVTTNTKPSKEVQSAATKVTANTNSNTATNMEEQSKTKETVTTKPKDEAGEDIEKVQGQGQDGSKASEGKADNTRGKDKDDSPKDRDKQGNDPLPEGKGDKNPRHGNKEGHGYYKEDGKAESRRASDDKDEAVLGAATSKEASQEVQSTGTEVTEAKDSTTTTTNEEDKHILKEAVTTMTKEKGDTEEKDDTEDKQGQLKDQDEVKANDQGDNEKQDKDSLEGAGGKDSKQGDVEGHNDKEEKKASDNIGEDVRNKRNTPQEDQTTDTEAYKESTVTTMTKENGDTEEKDDTEDKQGQLKDQDEVKANDQGDNEKQDKDSLEGAGGKDSKQGDVEGHNDKEEKKAIDNKGEDARNKRRTPQEDQTTDTEAYKESTGTDNEEKATNKDTVKTTEEQKEDRHDEQGHRHDKNKEKADSRRKSQKKDKDPLRGEDQKDQRHSSKEGGDGNQEAVEANN